MMTSCFAVKKIISTIILVGCLSVLPCRYAFSQHPVCFKYNDENGLPSNEVYNIAQDNKGFIWIGSDAGLYKYNGTGYIRYTSPGQKSKSITGLVFSTSNTLYCYNFHSQIFYIRNDTLTELSHSLKTVTNLAADHSGNLFVTHREGISSYNEKSRKWTKHYIKNTGQTNNTIAKSVRVNAAGEVYFVT